MGERFLTPPYDLGISDSTPLVFLEGPVQGARNWQSEAAQELLARRGDIAVASPRRIPKDQPEKWTKKDSDIQVAWEEFTIERARDFGAIGMWMAAQDLEDITYPAGRAFGQTSRVEFGEALGWRWKEPSLPLVVGFDPNYTRNGGGSEGYMRRKMKLKQLPVYDSRQEFLEALIAVVPYSR